MELKVNDWVKMVKIEKGYDQEEAELYDRVGKVIEIDDRVIILQGKEQEPEVYVQFCDNSLNEGMPYWLYHWQVELIPEDNIALEILKDG